MVDEFRREIERIQRYISSGRLTSFDETQTKATAIEPIFRELGWDVADPDEVRREYSVRARPNARPVDYLLFCDDTPKVIVEAKRGNQSLQRHQEQLQDYTGFALAKRVEIAILTNGAVWWYYLPLRDASWERRRVATVEFNQQDSKEIAQTLVDLLSKENVRSGTAIQNAERQQIAETLPSIWNQLIIEGENTLVSLLIERSQGSCVRRPDTDEVRRFLSTYSQQIQIMTPPTAPELNAPPEPEATPEPARSGSTREILTAFTFNGKRYEISSNGRKSEASSWREMIVKLCEIVHRGHTDQFDDVLDFRGTSRTYFSRNPNDLHGPRLIDGTDIFVDAKYKTRIERIVKRLIPHFGYDENDLSYELRT